MANHQTCSSRSWGGRKGAYTVSSCQEGQMADQYSRHQNYRLHCNTALLKYLQDQVLAQRLQFVLLIL